MKGIVFVELIKMAESAMGESAVDDVLDRLELDSDGAFSTVGNYPCRELLALVDAFGAHLDAPVDALQKQFGLWMFQRFVEGYPIFFKDKTDGFDMLASIEDEVHVEVRKLYPEVELPTFSTQRLAQNTFQMIYSSERPLEYFCLGLIEGCMAHFEHVSTIEMKRVDAVDRYVAEFTISRAAA